MADAFDRKFSNAYMDAQLKFYSCREDESRKVLYSQFDFDLRGKRILDVGCGFGKDTAHFQKMGAEVYGIDSSEEMLSLARQKNPGLKRLSVGTSEKTGFESGFFDAVFARYSFYSADLGDTFREIHRVLKPEGFIVLIVPHPVIDYAAKKEKDYGRKETVSYPLFEEGFLIEGITHTFSEYLSPFVLEKFELANFYESSTGGNRENRLEENVPDFIMLKLRKRLLPSQP